MTEEQIRQNAKAYADNAMKVPAYTRAYDSFIAGAHSRDEEIKELKEQRDNFKDRLLDALEKRDQLRNPWISVEERLPDEGQAVIVHLAFGAGNHAACNYINGQFVWALCIETSNVNIQSRLKLPAITHWMPIPELKEGE